MNRLIFSFSLFFLCAIGFAQNSGLGFNYQAVVRGTDGYLMPSKVIELRFSLMLGQQATEASWIETHSVTTDALGTIGVTVGKGEKAGGIAATFADVNFAAIHYWLKVEIREGSNYRELSYTALASVPYAEVATNVVNSPTVVTYSGPPAGSVVAFAGDASKVPNGWILCDGRSVLRSDYPALFEAIGTAWGNGDDMSNSSTFRVPYMVGMFLRGVDPSLEIDQDANERVGLYMGGGDYSNSGNNVGSFQGDAIRNITGRTEPGHYSPIFSPSGAFTSVDTKSYSEPSFHATGPSGLVFDASRVVPTGSDNRPKNVYVNYIIKY